MPAVPLAGVIEAIVQTMKPIWDKTAGKISTAEIVSMAIGVVIAVVAKIYDNGEARIYEWRGGAHTP